MSCSSLETSSFTSQSSKHHVVFPTEIYRYSDVTDVSNCVRSALNVVDMIGEIGNFHCNKRTYKVSRSTRSLHSPVADAFK